MNRKLLFVVVSFFLFLGVDRALTKAPVDVTNMSIEELLDAMDKGYLTSESLVKIYLERIEAYDEVYNAINQLNDKALEEAIELDKMRENGEIKGKLHGIPILVKSNIDVVGLATNAGIKALNDNYPIENATVVQRLVDEGAIILGSCNMSALAFSAQTSYSSFGYVKNIFDETKTAYGSSGGSAVAVAATFAAAALGTDTNSSVRAPASGAGLVGIRPTYGLVSHSGVIPYDFERDTVGVLSKNVQDNSLLLSIIAGVDEKDETTFSAIVNDYKANTSLEGKKIGVLTQYVKGSSRESGITGETDTEIYELLENSIKKLEEAGAEIIYLDKFVKYSNLTIASSTQAGGTMCDYFNEYIKGTMSPIKSFKELANKSGTVWDLGGYVKSCGVQVKDKNERDSKKQIYRDYVDEYFADYELDVVLYPTIKNKASGFRATGNLVVGNSFGSVIGYPSITVPMGKADDGISYGIEFLAQAYEENILYDVASSFEKVNGNEIDSSIKVPSLYEVPETVTTLISLYESLDGDLKEEIMVWKNDVTEFLGSYNVVEDVNGKAIELLDTYRMLTESKKENSDTRIIVLYSIIGLTLLCTLIIVKELFTL